MNKKLALVIILLCSLLFVGVQPAFSQDSLPDGSEEPIEPPPIPDPPGTVIGFGTYFEITDSEYLNITLESSEPVQIMLESVPEMIVMQIESSGANESATFKLGGLGLTTTYYKYEDDNYVPSIVTSDENGIYTFSQDLSQPHVIFIQPQPSTKLIPGDNTGGVWNPQTRTYTLTTNVYEQIYIAESNFTLDGNGHTVYGSGGSSGIYINNKPNVTIKNLNVMGFYYGMYNHNSPGNFVNNSFASNRGQGIRLWNSHGNIFTDNSVEDNLLEGIALYYSNGNTLTNNRVSANGYSGVYLYSGSENSLTDNEIINQNRSMGIYLNNSANNTIIQNNVHSNYAGISLSYANHNLVEQNALAHNSWDAIRVSYSNENEIKNNSITNTDSGNTGYGIRLYSANNNTLACNTSANNWFGIALFSSSENNIKGNELTANSQDGLWFYNHSDNNIVQGNKIVSNNSDGIAIFSSGSNKIFNNNFIDNNRHAMGNPLYENYFNLESPIGGNYWNDWTGPDDDNDGFVDFPYEFSWGQDNLPWVEEFNWSAKAQADPLLAPIDSDFTFDGSESYGDVSYYWDFGDGNYSNGVSVTHSYSDPGIYDVTLTVTDDIGCESSDTISVVVYDPDGGFVTGGGWIWSGLGTYPPDPDMAGWANFGFVAKYHKGAEVPDGQAELVYHTVGMNFHSTSYDWMVVAGSDRAKFKGTGTINGGGDYKFMIWAGDGDPDTFRIKIWEETGGDEVVVYDNSLEHPSFENGQPIGNGNIIIHKPGESTAEVLDQSQTHFHNGYVFDEDVVRWQEFIPTFDNISAIEIYIGKEGNPGNVNVEIRTVDGIVLGQEIISEAEIHHYGWVRIDFSLPIYLTLGTKYRIYVYSDQDPPSFDNHYAWFGDLDSSYNSDCRNDVINQLTIEDFDYAFKTFSITN